MTPLYAAGGITEAEIESLEAQLLMIQLGLEGDVKSADIQQVISFYVNSTAKIISKNGTVLRNKLDTS